MNRRDLLKLGVAAALPLLARPSAAQGVPLRIVTGFPAGGGLDLAARLIGEQISTTLNRPVIVEPKPGAAGRLAVQYVKAAPPDGNTMLLTPASMMVIYPSTFKSLGYDPVSDFVPVAGTVLVQFGLAVRDGIPVNNVADYVSWVKADPKRALYGTPAAGSTPSFLGGLFSHAAGLDLKPVDYKGNAPLINDLIGGHLDAGFATVGDMVEYHRQKKLRVLAVAGKERSPALPDVPTFRELGYTTVDGEEWYGFFLPRGTPQSIADTYAKAIAAAVMQPKLVERWRALGWRPIEMGPAALEHALKADGARWRDIVARSGYVPQE